MNRLENGEPENNLHEQSNRTLSQELQRNQRGTRSSVISADCTSDDEDTMEIPRVTAGDSVGTSSSNLRLVCVAMKPTFL